MSLEREVIAKVPKGLYIDGAWRDHLVFALTAEEIPEGLLARWRRIGRSRSAPNASENAPRDTPRNTA